MIDTTDTTQKIFRIIVPKIFMYSFIKCREITNVDALEQNPSSYLNHIVAHCVPYHSSLFDFIRLAHAVYPIVLIRWFLSGEHTSRRNPFSIASGCPFRNHHDLHTQSRIAYSFPQRRKIRYQSAPMHSMRRFPHRP